VCPRYTPGHCHSDIFDLVTLSLISGIKMGELSRLVWLMGFVKHALWVDSLYFPMFPKE
jgi:hypothetical protein